MGKSDVFDKYYDEKLLVPAQRSYLRSGKWPDVATDMQNLLHLKENYVAAATSSDYFDVA